MIEPQLLSLYRQRAGQIDALHAVGRISGAERRDRLERLRAGMEIKPRAEQSLNALIRSVASAERQSERQRDNDREYRARRKAAASTNA